ncbi:hypothetical protein RI845_01355 [Thalassotalea nanhaiensis]|uniref:PepSY domain-containing protein n=1 Tax=Thalassotalea nanhaiensis TaxID=3065648 RepID=A0ABY9TK50_9GAMM|nr:hypothetical protein RI845_01355 [Colwelliaceae bacterium SQ345]
MRHKSIKTLGVLIAFFTAAFSVNAAELTHGEAQAAIRSADFACNHVINLKSSGDNTWMVKCNSGIFSITRDKNGKFTVSQVE